ncbi:MAG: DUF86 domain-containing protein [Cyclobacteriaceae bacterium]|nr:DUF86 domain-containing protein [Cyclobacteriaceae bacterium]
MAKGRYILLYLNDISESIEKIESYISDIAEHEFIADQEKPNAVIRRLEIIGEAVKKIPENVKDQYPTVPWRQIAGLRDVVIHEYFGVSPALIYKTATTDLIDLKITIQRIIDDTSKKN